MGEHQLWLIGGSKQIREGLNLSLDGSSFPITYEATDIASLNQLCRNAPPPSLMLLSVPAASVESDERLFIENICDMQIAPVLLLAATLSLRQLVSGMKAGARGYVQWNVPGDVLLYCIRTAIAGERVFPSELVDQAVRAIPVGTALNPNPWRRT